MSSGSRARSTLAGVAYVAIGISTLVAACAPLNPDGTPGETGDQFVRCGRCPGACCYAAGNPDPTCATPDSEGCDVLLSCGVPGDCPSNGGLFGGEPEQCCLQIPVFGTVTSECSGGGFTFAACEYVLCTSDYDCAGGFCVEGFVRGIPVFVCTTGSSANPDSGSPAVDAGADAGSNDASGNDASVDDASANDAAADAGFEDAPVDALEDGLDGDSGG